MRKPTTLYYFSSDHNRLEKHKITKDCFPRMVYENLVQSDQIDYWRCRNDKDNHGDHYGHGTLNAAKEAEIISLKEDISHLQYKLKKLTEELTK